MVSSLSVFIYYTTYLLDFQYVKPEEIFCEDRLIAAGCIFITKFSNRRYLNLYFMTIFFNFTKKHLFETVLSDIIKIHNLDDIKPFNTFRIMYT